MIIIPLVLGPMLFFCFCRKKDVTVSLNLAHVKNITTFCWLAKLISCHVPPFSKILAYTSVCFFSLYFKGVPMPLTVLYIVSETS